MLSADVGGTGLGAGVVSPAGDVYIADEGPTLAGGPGSALPTILERLAGAQARAGREGIRLIGCGVGVPGPVDVAAGRVGPDVQNLPELAGCALGEAVARRTGLATVVDNDANALALGEAWFGRGHGRRSLVLLALGTGVGGGIVLDGQLVRGATGYGGELGHAAVDFGGRPCFCGGRGCLKAYVAGPDIVAQACEALARFPESRLARAGGCADLTARDVFEAAAGGDELGREIVARVCRALGIAIGGILNTLNPEAVLLTGGVAQSLAPWLQTVRRWAAAQAFAPAYEAATIEIVPHTKAVAIRGAAALFLHEAARRAIGSPAS